MTEYHFDLGNSTHGPIGMCAKVRASSKEKALAILQASLPDEIEVPFLSDEEIVYVQVYISANNITTADIDDEEEVSD